MRVSVCVFHSAPLRLHEVIGSCAPSPQPAQNPPPLLHRTDGEGRVGGEGEFAAKSSRRANLVGREAGTGLCSTKYRRLKSAAPCAFVAAAAQSWRQAPVNKREASALWQLEWECGK